MNALITDSDIGTAARSLDPDRCYKQAVECKQMLKGLYRLEDSNYYNNMPKRCSVCYWKNWEQLLAAFGRRCSQVAENKYGYDVNKNLQRFLHDLEDPCTAICLPWWMKDGSEWLIHQRKLLLSKDYDFYSELWPDIEPDPRRFYPIAESPGEFEIRKD